jgi:hypothetical protein
VVSPEIVAAKKMDELAKILEEKEWMMEQFHLIK